MELIRYIGNGSDVPDVDLPDDVGRHRLRARSDIVVDVPRADVDSLAFEDLAVAAAILAKIDP